MAQPLDLGRFRVAPAGWNPVGWTLVTDRLAGTRKLWQRQVDTIQPNCPLRQQIIGPYHVRHSQTAPKDVVQAVLIGLVIGLGTIGLVQTHDTWMFYVELLISLCT